MSSSTSHLLASQESEIDRSRYRRLITNFADRFADQLVELGVVSARDLGELAGAIIDHLARPTTIVVRAMTVQAWGIAATRSGGDAR